MADTHFTPYESQEFAELDYWRELSKKGELETVPCVAAWSDICGFGSALESADWQLKKIRGSGLFNALSQTYSLLGSPFITGVPPMPTDRVLVINDGVARTTDLVDAKYVQHAQMMFYVRDLLMHHFILERQLVALNLGLRTVLAGGERCQYSPQKSTGQLFLSYTNEPSEYGKKFLQQQFVYNPAEFQMNTAFALAYTLEALGTSGGFIPNRIYIEERWLKTINSVIPEPSIVNAKEIVFPWHTIPGISISFDDCRVVTVKGIATTIFRVSRFVVHEQFEGETTEFPMSEHDRQNL
ncbi:MAG: hypothetical protein WBK26_13860 [Burkholderiaceae bacterium]